MKYLVVLIPQNSNGHLALCTDQRNLELEVVVLSFFLNCPCKHLVALSCYSVQLMVDVTCSARNHLTNR